MRFCPECQRRYDCEAANDCLGEEDDGIEQSDAEFEEWFNMQRFEEVLGG